MKSFLQNVALVSAVALVSSCDSSSGGSVNTPPPTPPVNIAKGTAIKGAITGAPVTATDADGDPLGTSTTSAGGNYSLTYDVTQVAAGVKLPVKISVGSGDSVCDIDIAGTDDDCPTGDTALPFVAFGASYTLPAGFTLTAYLPAQTVTSSSTEDVFVSPATHIAAQKAEAATGGATVDNVNASSAAIAGLIQAITGIDLSGTPLHQIEPVDITGNGASGASVAQLALASFASAILAGRTGTESVSETLARFSASITIGADGNASASGTDLAAIATAVSTSLATVAAQSNNPAITAAIQTATDNAALYTNFGTTPVKVPPVATPGTDKTEVQKTQDFVASLGTVINGVLTTTGASNSASGISVTDAFATELDGVAKLSSDAASKATTRLSDALIAAATKLTASSTDTVETNDAATEDGLEFVLTQTATGFTATGVSSTWPLTVSSNSATSSVAASTDSASTTQVVVSAATGTADTSSISVPALTMVTTTDGTTTQTFTGAFAATNTLVDTAPQKGKYSSVSFNGSIAGQTTGTGFGVDVTFADLDTNPNRPTGTYTAKVSFTHASAADVSLAFNGTISSAVQNFTVTSGTSAINGSVTRAVSNGVTTDTDVLSDGTAFLTLTVVDGIVSKDANNIIGSFTVGTGDAVTTTGTLNSDGQVTYSDGAVQFLPGVIF